MAPQAFVLKIPDAAIADLKPRLSLTRFPDSAPGEPWAYGISVDYIRDLVSYWKDSFDWRAQEAALNAFPQFKVPLHDIDLHFLHVPVLAVCCVCQKLDSAILMVKAAKDRS